MMPLRRRELGLTPTLGHSYCCRKSGRSVKERRLGPNLLWLTLPTKQVVGMNKGKAIDLQTFIQFNANLYCRAVIRRCFDRLVISLGKIVKSLVL
jgi:hypothetical protein